MKQYIPVGYRLAITTWENDADNYRTEELFGLSEADVHFFVALAKRFNSKNGYLNPGVGNQDLDSEIIQEIIDEVLEEHPTTSSYVRSWNKETCAHSKIYEILSHPVEYDWGFVRVFERFEVNFIPEVISYDFPDLSEQFE